MLTPYSSTPEKYSGFVGNHHTVRGVPPLFFKLGIDLLCPNRPRRPVGGRLSWARLHTWPCKSSCSPGAIDAFIEPRYKPSSDNKVFQTPRQVEKRVDVFTVLNEQKHAIPGPMRQIAAPLSPGSGYPDYKRLKTHAHAKALTDSLGLPTVRFIRDELQLSSVFLVVRGLYTNYTLLACLRENLRKPTRPARGAYASTSQLPGAYANAYAGKC